jgi:starch phosphorylase
MNEGHAVFLTLALLKDNNNSEAKVREKCVFTTHTPVPAGHDKFEYDLVESTLGPYLPPNIRALAGEEVLNTTLLALNLSRASNGVSELHGEISRQMFPRFDIGHITNGVHHLSWTGPEFQALFDAHTPNWRQQPQTLSEADKIPDDAIRQAKLAAKKRLISYVNAQTGAGFSEDFLTICFARRATAYKRATLLFADMEYLLNLSFDRVQYIFAGKAHPQDGAGKELIKEIIKIQKQYEHKLRLVFIPNYTIWLGALMTQGTDVWLNTPRRPREASGTSGMKVVLNGGVNMSVLDGWWREACKNRINGWAIGDDEDQTDDQAAADLYHDLDDMVTTYYANPRQWTSIMKRSIADIAPQFNTQRMVLEYLHKYYL